MHEAARAERALNLGIAWLIAVPILVSGYVLILLPVAFLLPHDCFQAECPTGPGDVLPSVLLPSAIVISGSVVVSVVLRRLFASRRRVAHRAIGAIGAGLVLAAAAASLAIGRPETTLAAYVWPGFPGVALVSAAWRLGSSAARGAADPRGFAL